MTINHQCNGFTIDLYPDEFEPIQSGKRTYLYFKKVDRCAKPNDIVLFREKDDDGKLTGKTCTRRISDLKVDYYEDASTIYATLSLSPFLYENHPSLQLEAK